MAAPTRTRRPARPRTPTTAEQHAEWLGLLRPDGPFLTVPVLTAALPHGLDTVPGEVRDRLRQGWAEVQEAPDLLSPAWCDLVLAELLCYPAGTGTDGAALPAEPAGGPRPDLVLSGPEPGGGQAARLHGYRRPAGTPLTRARGDQPALADQVLRAVELFVGELARLDRESGQALDGVSDRDIYRGALTVLMRMVFLLYAEEQRLLPVADPLYAQAYAASTLYDQLDEIRSQSGDEIGDRRSAAWPKLLALFAAIPGGCEHPDLRIPAHGESLFDPARFRGWPRPR